MPGPKGDPGPLGERGIGFVYSFRTLKRILWGDDAEYMLGWEPEFFSENRAVLSAHPVPSGYREFSAGNPDITCFIVPTACVLTRVAAYFSIRVESDAACPHDKMRSCDHLSGCRCRPFLKTALSHGPGKGFRVLEETRLTTSEWWKAEMEGEEWREASEIAEVYVPLEVGDRILLCGGLSYENGASEKRISLFCTGTLLFQ